MKKIINPWQGMEGYACYGCCPDSEKGLRMEFMEDGDYIVSRWTPRHEFEGWQNTLHGGIQATLADEIASWTVFRKLQTGGVTSKMEVRYLRPVHVDDGDIELRAHIIEQRRNLVRIAVTITNGRGELATEVECLYFTFPQERARDEFMFREFRCEDEE